MSFDIAMTINDLHALQVQVMQMRIISHRLHRGIKANVITTVEGAERVAHFVELELADAEAEVWAVLALSVVLVHLDKEVGRVVVDRKWVILVVVHAHDIAVPGHATSEEM